MKKSTQLKMVKAIATCFLLLVSFAGKAQYDQDDYYEMSHENDYWYEKEERLYEESYNVKDLYNGRYRKKKAYRESNDTYKRFELIGNLDIEEENDKLPQPETIETKPFSSSNTPVDSSVVFDPEEHETPPPPTEPGVPVDTAIPLLIVMGVFVALKGIVFKS